MDFGFESREVAYRKAEDLVREEYGQEPAEWNSALVPEGPPMISDKEDSRKLSRSALGVLTNAIPPFCHSVVRVARSSFRIHSAAE